MSDLHALRMQVRDSSGWEYLLPRAVQRRWLCLDTTGGATALLLAPLCDELQVVPAHRAMGAEIAEKLRAQGVVNARLVERICPERDSPKAGGLNGFILHDLGGVLGERAVEDALRAAARLVSGQGFLYAALRNRYGYTRLRRVWSDLGRNHGGAYFSAHSVQRLLGERPKITRYSLINDGDGRLTDLVPACGYVSAKNPTLPNEYVRRWLLGPRGALRWSPGFALVAAGDPQVRSGLASALESLGAHGLMRVPDDPNRLVKRYHVVDGKVILSVGETSARYGSHIVVLARFDTYAARRRREAELLSRLAALPAEIASRIPRFFYEEEVGGARIFVLQEFPGVTLDAPGAGLREATRDAVEFLVLLHSATRRPVRLTSERIKERVGPAFETARSRYPALVALLNRLEEAMHSVLVGVELPLVWMHGDFKIENIVIDELSHRLLGVIDWEHSEPGDLPLLDLWYLLLYNRQIERRGDFLDVAGQVLHPSGFDREEAALCADYVRSLQVPSPSMPALAGALILYHVTRRTLYDPNDSAVMDRLSSLLLRAAESIERAAKQ